MKTYDLRVWNWRTLVLDYSPENAHLRLLLLTLSCHMNDVGESCFPSVATLVKETAMTKPTVIKYLKEAEREGWIEISKHGYAGQKWKRNEYKATIPSKVVREINHVGGKTGEKGGKADEVKVVKEVNPNSIYNPTTNSTVKSVGADTPSLPEVAEYGEEAMKIARYLLDSIKQYDPTHKYHHSEPSLDRWVLDLERAMRLDGRNMGQLKFVIDYIFRMNGENSAFWASNIQSGGALRDKFDTIKNQIRNEKQKRERGQYGTTKQQREERIKNPLAGIKFSD